MASPHEQFRAALEVGDVETLRAIWSQAMPHLPCPDRAQAEVVMHRARTEAESLPLRVRAYSHRWLVERNLPSGLPDLLKPSAERLYPRIAEAVGFAWSSQSPVMRPAKQIIQQAVGDAICDIYADDPSPPVPMVRARMQEVKDRALHSLFGNIAKLKRG